MWPERETSETIHLANQVQVRFVQGTVTLTKEIH